MSSRAARQAGFRNSTHIARLRSRRSRHASQAGPAQHLRRGATHRALAADRSGNIVSWVNTTPRRAVLIGITVPPAHGFVLHNRGALSRSDHQEPERACAPQWPFNTLSAGFVMHTILDPLITVTPHGLRTCRALPWRIRSESLRSTVARVGLSAPTFRLPRRWPVSNHKPGSTPCTSRIQSFRAGGERAVWRWPQVAATNGGAIGGYQASCSTPDADAPARATNGSSVVSFYRGGSESPEGRHVVA